MKKTYLIILFVLLLSVFLVSAAPDSTSDENTLTTSSGIEIDNIVTLVASVMALTLFALTYISFKRDGRKRLLYVAIAFLLFAIKGVMQTLDIFYPNTTGWIDVVASLLDFAILLSFFFGILKK